MRRLHEERGVAPVHVHVTYNMGLAHGKRWRLRQAGAWLEPWLGLGLGLGLGSGSGLGLANRTLTS